MYKMLYIDFCMVTVCLFLPLQFVIFLQQTLESGWRRQSGSQPFLELPLDLTLFKLFPSFLTPPQSLLLLSFSPELSSFIFPLKGRTTRVLVIHLRGGTAAAFFFFSFFPNGFFGQHPFSTRRRRKIFRGTLRWGPERKKKRKG